MTSEGQQHPGYGPEDAGPDAGGEAPYGTNGPRFGDELPRRRADRGQQQQPDWPADERGGWPPSGGYGAAGGGWPPGDDRAYPSEREQAERHTPTERWSQPPASSSYQPPEPPIPNAGRVPAPLPPQETRIPGASLAADYPGSDAGYPPSVPAPRPASEAPATGRVPVPQPTHHPAGPSYGEGPFDPSSSAPPSSGPPSSGPPAAGGAAASASVPMSSRAVPAEDRPVPPDPSGPQPRVYGRPTAARGADEVPEAPYPPRGPLPPQGPSQFPPPPVQPDQYGQRPPYGPDAGPGAGRRAVPGQDGPATFGQRDAGIGYRPEADETRMDPPAPADSGPQQRDETFGPRGYGDGPGQQRDETLEPRGYGDGPGRQRDETFGPPGYGSTGAGQQRDEGFGTRGYGSTGAGRQREETFGPPGYGSTGAGQQREETFGPPGYGSTGAGPAFPDARPNGRPNPPGVYGARANPPDEPGAPMTGRSGPSAPSGLPLGGSGTYGAGPSSPAPQGFGGSHAYPGPQDFRGDRPMSPPGPVEAFRPGPSGWGAPAQQHQQDRFGSFPPETDDRPAADPSPRPAAAKERNGRVLAMVLAAAVLLLVIPLGLVWAFTRSDGTTFDPAVGDCIKQSGDSAVTANCAEPGAYVVQSKVDDAKRCPDAKQPHVAVPGGGTNQILCLAPAPAASAGASTAPAPSAT